MVVVLYDKGSVSANSFEIALTIKSKFLLYEFDEVCSLQSAFLAHIIVRARLNTIASGFRLPFVKLGQFFGDLVNGKVI